MPPNTVANAPNISISGSDFLTNRTLLLDLGNPAPRDSEEFRKFGPLPFPGVEHDSNPFGRLLRHSPVFRLAHVPTGGGVVIEL